MNKKTILAGLALSFSIIAARPVTAEEFFSGSEIQESAQNEPYSTDETQVPGDFTVNSSNTDDLPTGDDLQFTDNPQAIDDPQTSDVSSDPDEVFVSEDNQQYEVSATKPSEQSTDITAYSYKKMNDFVSKHITASMSDYEKVETIVKWLGEVTIYSPEYCTGEELMYYGKGDCVASMQALVYMYNKAGLKAYERYAGDDPWAGSPSHMNTLVMIDGIPCVVDISAETTTPRSYWIVEMNSFSYKVLNDNTIMLIKYEGTDTNVKIPGEIDGYTVSAIADLTMPKSSVSVKSIEIPSSVTTIGSQAFYGCTDLKSISVDPQNPNYSSKNGILYDKSQTKLLAYPSGRSGNCTVENGVTTIGSYAFSYMSPNYYIILPESVQTIEDMAFSDSYPLRLTIKGNHINLGKDAFANTTGTIVVSRQSGIKTQVKHEKWELSIVTSNISKKAELRKDWFLDLPQKYTIYPLSNYAAKPDITLTQSAPCLIEGRDYKVTYKNNKKPGTGTVLITGKGMFTGTVKKNFKIYKFTGNFHDALNIHLAKKDYTYTGKAIKPTPSVYSWGKKLISSPCKFSYKNNKNPGIATVTLTKYHDDDMNYSVTFNILPKKVTISKIAPKAGGFTLTWKKSPKVTDYQIQYATSPTFSTGAKTQRTTKTTTTLSNLPANTTYYVRVRAYKKVGQKHLYGAWSKTAMVNTQ